MKNNIGLVEFVKVALTEKWGYVWGTFGLILSQILFDAKLIQYPTDVGKFRKFIQGNWLGKRTVDCVGLIKAYIWWQNKDPVYNDDTDVSADGMYNTAKEKGPIDTIPEIPGLCVWKKGHIGVYIGKGQVIEAHGTMFGVIQTPLKGTGSTPWTHWLKCPFIEYTGELRLKDKGEEVEGLQKKLVSLGYKIAVDGVFGSCTDICVRNFQINNNLIVDGVVGKTTMDAIDAMLAKLNIPKKKDWMEIIKSSKLDNETEWVKIIKMAESGEDISGQYILKFLPKLIEKIGNK